MPIPLLLPLLLAGAGAATAVGLGEKASAEDQKLKESAKRAQNNRETGKHLLQTTDPSKLDNPDVATMLLGLGITPEEIEGTKTIGQLNNAAFLGFANAANPSPPSPMTAPGAPTKAPIMPLPAQLDQPSVFPVEQVIREEPIPSAPPPPTPPAPLTVPPTRQPITATRQIGGTNFSITKPGMTGKDVTNAVIAQAETQHMHPNQVVQSLQQANLDRVKAGQPPIDLDEATIKGYGTRHWEYTRNQNYQQMLQAGVDPNVAFQQSAVSTFKTLGYVPENWMQVVKPSDADIQNGAFKNAISQTNALIDSAMSMMAAKPTMTFRDFDQMFPVDYLGRAIEQQPGLSPENVIRTKHEAATKLAAELDRKLMQAYPDMTEFQRQAKALQLAGAAVGGEVPPQWMSAALNKPQLFGLSQEQVAAYSAMPPQDRPSLFDPIAPTVLQDAVVQMETSKEYRSKAMALATTPETLEMTRQQLTPPAATPNAPAAPTPAQIGETQRGMALEQKGKEERQHKTIEREFAVAPSAEIEKIKPVDDLYGIGVRVQQLVSQKDKTGRTFLDKYGDEPAIYFSSKQAFQKQFGAVPDEVAKYIALIGKVFNVEKKTFAGTATSLNERSDLLTFMADPKENVRTAIQKLNALVSVAGSELERDLGYVSSNYPGTKLEMFNYPKIKELRKKKANAAQ